MLTFRHLKKYACFEDVKNKYNTVDKFLIHVFPRCEIGAKYCPLGTKIWPSLFTRGMSVFLKDMFTIH